MNWDEYFMNLARSAALKSEDPSTQVGCVIVSPNNEVISCGFNNFPLKTNREFMTDEKPMRYLLSVHAEMRALLHAKRSVENCRVYVTHASCENCLKHMIVAGIKEITYDKLFTNGKFIDEQRTEAIIRLMNATGIVNRNMNGKSFIEDVKENS